jgi:hypothetical protein
MTPHWSIALRSLVELHRATPPRTDAHGSIQVSFDGVMASSARILAELPGEWSLVDHDSDVEWVSELWTCRGELAIFACVDHWQAGLFGALGIYPSKARYAAAVWERLERGDGPIARYGRRR